MNAAELNDMIEGQMSVYSSEPTGPRTLESGRLEATSYDTPPSSDSEVVQIVVLFASSVVDEESSPPEGSSMQELPTTRYARSGELSIAYQVARRESGRSGGRCS